MPEYFVACGERKKILSIPTKNELLNVVKQKFDIGDNIKVVIQVFNTTYNEYVDIDSDSEELPVAEKLNVVQLSETYEINERLDMLDAGLPATFNTEQAGPSTSNDTAGLTNNEITAATLTPSTSWWPSKFVLPVCKFGDTLKTAMSSKETLTPALRTALMDTLYAEITAYTFYPTSSQYNDVVQSLLSAYPHLRTFVIGDITVEGDSCVRKWKNMLADKLRNMRKRRDKDVPQVAEKVRQVKRRKGNTTVTTPTVVTPARSGNQWGVANFLPERPCQEDDTSMLKAKDWMKSEYVKKRQDTSGIQLRMDLTFADRRKDIVEKQMSINDIKRDYPCLFMEDEILREFKRLTDIELDNTFLAGVGKYGSKLMEKAPVDLQWKKRIMKAVSGSKTETERRRLAGYGSLLVLPHLMKEQLHNIICPEDSKPENVTTPLLIYEGELTQEEEPEYRLIIDNVEIARPLEFIQAIEYLIASYYTFNVAYPPNCINSLTFIQKCIIGLADNAATPRKVVSLLLKLSK